MLHVCGIESKDGFHAPVKKSIRTLLLGTPQTLHLRQDRQGTWRSHPDIFLSVFIFLYKTCSLPRIHLCHVTQSPSSVAWRGKKRLGGRLIFLGRKIRRKPGRKHRKDIICSYPGQNVCTVFHLFQNLDTRSTGQIFLIVQQSTNTINRA